ncbi:MAG: hypothetical protein WBJ10_15950, partial [Daejeonella sp.]
MKAILYVLSISFILQNCVNRSDKDSIYSVTNPHVSEKNKIKFNDMLGVNVYEWNFLQDPNSPGAGSTIFEPKMSLIKSFSGVRHYLDWEKLEDSPGSYTFNPTRRGGWNYDAIYERCKRDGILVLSCIKEAPNWLYN